MGCGHSLNPKTFLVSAIVLLILVQGGIAALDPPFVPLDGKSTVRALESLHKANKVWMSHHEQSLLESYLRPSDIMLEYGSGFSTLWYSQFVKKYYSIEHNQEWYEAISPEIYKLPNVQYMLSAVEKGHLGWQGGFSEGTPQQFETYIKAVDEVHNVKFDRVLIDGRSRAACAKYILKFLHKDSIIFIHDYHMRTYYHDTLDAYYTKVAIIFEGQSIVVARPKLNVLAALNASLPLEGFF